MDQFKENFDQLQSESIAVEDAKQHAANIIEQLPEEIDSQDLEALSSILKGKVDTANEDLKSALDKLDLSEEQLKDMDSESLVLTIVKEAGAKGLDAVQLLLPILGQGAALVVKVAWELMTNPNLEIVRNVIAEVLPELLLDFVDSKLMTSKVKENYALSWILSIADRQLENVDLVELLATASAAAGIAQDWQQSLTDALLGNTGLETITSRNGVTWDIYYTPKLTIAKARDNVLGPDIRVFKIRESMIQSASNKLLGLIPYVGGVLSGALDRVANLDDVEEIKRRISQASPYDIGDFLVQLYQYIQQDKARDQVNSLIDDLEEDAKERIESDPEQSPAQYQPENTQNDAISSSGLDSTLSKESNELHPDLVRLLESSDQDSIPGGNFTSIPVPARGRERKKY